MITDNQTPKIIEARKMLLDYLQQQAKENGITQQEMAARSGIYQNNISRVFSGKYSPTLDNFIRLCEAANVYLFIIDKSSDDDLCETMRKRWKRNADQQ